MCFPDSPGTSILRDSQRLKCVPTIVRRHHAQYDVWLPLREIIKIEYLTDTGIESNSVFTDDEFEQKNVSRLSDVSFSLRAWNAIRSMKSFAIANQKGGVAKTTNTINLAGGAANRGYEVLVIDADPQGHLTNTLSFRDAYAGEPPSLYNLFNSPNEHDPTDVIVEHTEFDVLPSNVDMFRLEQDLIASGRRPRQRLGDILDDIDGYDYVFVDAPPSLGPINDNVLLACRNLLIPVEAAESSMLALEHLLNQIESLERDYDVRLRERAVLISNVNYPLDNPQRDAIDWFHDTFDDRCPVFEIRKRAAIKRALNNSGSVFNDDAEESDMRAVYNDIVTALEEVTADERR